MHRAWGLVGRLPTIRLGSRCIHSVGFVRPGNGICLWLCRSKPLEFEVQCFLILKEAGAGMNGLEEESCSKSGEEHKGENFSL